MVTLSYEIVVIHYLSPCEENKHARLAIILISGSKNIHNPDNRVIGDSVMVINRFPDIVISRR